MEKITCSAYLNGFLQWDENHNAKIEHSLEYTFSYSSYFSPIYQEACYSCKSCSA